MSEKIVGLTSAEVEAKTAAGLVNQTTDSASPSYLLISLRNIFNLINIFLIPLLLILLYFQKYQDVFVMSTFSVINSIVGIWDEVRIKRRLDKIQVEFAKKVKVFRDGREQEIMATDLVQDDVVKISEGEGLPTDGEVLVANNLQVDESLLTGESNYITKETGEKVLGGSFIISGECIYRVTSVGKDSYVNKLGVQSKAFRKEKSQLQRIGDRLTVFFVVSACIFGIAVFVATQQEGYSTKDAVVPLVTVVSLIIPQTLVFLFTFTFSISVLRLSQIGVLVQRASAVETLAKLDVLCFDKTGTITSGEMQVMEVKYWNVDKSALSKGFGFLENRAFGKNKTFETLVSFFNESDAYEVKEYTQNPFNSKTKLAQNQLKLENGKFMQFYYGAPPAMLKYAATEIAAEVQKFLAQEEEKGRRLILGVVHQTDQAMDMETDFTTNQVWIVSLKEEFNPGISDTLQQFQKLGTDLKVISGDSYNAITRILGELGVDLGKALDLSSFTGNLAEVVNDYHIFARAKPEDKLTITRALQAQGKMVGMVGDGVNDVLALKLSNLSIAMESGAKIAQDVSDVVLLKNDFGLVPRIIFEGENVIANLKFMNKLFLSKTLHAILFAILCVALGLVFPLLPTSILIYSFLGTSLPSYVVAFFRRDVTTGKNFWWEVLPDALFAGVISAIVSMVNYYQNLTLDPLLVNTIVMYTTLGFSLFFTLYQLWRDGFIVKLWQLASIFVVVGVVSVLASIVPLINNYYNVVFPGVGKLEEGLIVGIVGFLVYMVVQVAWDVAIGNKHRINSAVEVAKA